MDVEKDEYKIMKNYISNKKKNSLEGMHPEIAKLWHPTKNGGITPKSVSANTTKKYWWICKNGHEHFTSVNSKTRGRRSCIYCSGKKVDHNNSLLIIEPDVAKYWDYKKNELIPNNVSCSTNKSVWWNCDKGHNYKRGIKARINNRKCPYCTGYRLTLETFKEIAKIKGGECLSKEYKGIFSKIVLRCKYNHVWETTASVIKQGSWCPFCHKERNKIIIKS